MTEAQQEFIAKFNKEIEEQSEYCYITRDADLQKKSCERLEATLVEMVKQKAAAIAASDEHFANVILGCESLTKAIISEIRMWLLLKRDEPDAAWDQLVTAQGELRDAVRADPGFSDSIRRIRRLAEIERLVFPPQAFLSTGWIVKDEICSICEHDYEDCDHIKGRPYMGKFCYVRLIPQEVDHVSFVNSPANKHCRVIFFDAEGGKRNLMTWVVEPSDPNAKSESMQDGTMVQAIAATSSMLDEEH